MADDTKSFLIVDTRKRVAKELRRRLDLERTLDRAGARSCTTGLLIAAATIATVSLPLMLLVARESGWIILLADGAIIAALLRQLFISAREQVDTTKQAAIGGIEKIDRYLATVDDPVLTSLFIASLPENHGAIDPLTRHLTRYPDALIDSDRDGLCGLLNQHWAEHEPALVLAILSVIDKIAVESTLQPVGLLERALKEHSTAGRKSEVHVAAQACAARIEAALAARKQARTLLRATTAPDDAARLLRPADQGSHSDDTRLLRPRDPGAHG